MVFLKITPRITDSQDVTLIKGENGLSAYELAIQTGFNGTLEEYLESLKGQPGDSGMSIEKIGEYLLNDLIIEGYITKGDGNNKIEENVSFALSNGYRHPDTGALMTGTGWRVNASPIYTNGEETTYKLKHPNLSSNAQFRLITFINETTVGTSQICTINQEFTVDSDIVGFFFNLPVVASDPVSSLVSFPDIEFLNEITLVKVTENEGQEVEVQMTLPQILNSIESRIPSPSKTFKMLMIGNSFARDVTNHIHEICKSADVNVKIGVLYRPGESLEGHWNQIVADNASYTYYEKSNYNKQTSSSEVINSKFSTILKSDDWDLITYQQSSALSSTLSSYEPYLGNIINYVNTNKTNPNLKQGMHMTWAHSSNSTDPSFVNYDDREDMYLSIVSAYKNAMKSHDIDIIIPTGTAIESARINSDLGVIDDELTSDSIHLGQTGSVIGGLTIFESILAKKYNKDIFEDIKYSFPNSNYNIYLCKLVAKNATLNPFNVSNI